MRTKEDIEYDLKRMDEEEKIANMLLEKLKSNEQIMDNLTRCKAILSDCANKLSNLKIELPSCPPITDYPFICEKLNFEEVIIGGQNLQKKIDIVLKSLEENKTKKGKHKWKKQ